MLKQTPHTGTQLIVHAGDTITVSLETSGLGEGHAWLRSNLRGADIRRAETIAKTESAGHPLDRDWFDSPMKEASPGHFVLTVPVYEPGYFQAKTLFLPDGSDEPVWPEGDNIAIKVEPAERKNGNTVYSAFVRLFGKAAAPMSESISEAVKLLDKNGYNVIPESGKFRDLIKKLDTIVNHMGFRNILLLPIHPIPTTYARMGRFGSPFAALDLMDIDPALAEFDRKTTPLDQFRELIDAAHSRNASIFMDMPLNHTGWASSLQIHHPAWFTRGGKHEFQSPGAWGVTWEDLAELNYENKELWQYMADVFLYWCRLGVDGFRCDAGYMIPAEVWEYITAKVRQQFPDTVFLLEGLGGKKTVTRTLLTESNLNWAYSELFQNYDRTQIETYLPEAEHISRHSGLLIHFAETHDNNRLAATSRQYSSMRTSLCALLAQKGAFGTTCGSEWFAIEKIDVHDRTDLNWGAEDNQVDMIAALNSIISSHPAFLAGSTVELLHCGHANAILARRTSSAAGSYALIMANLDLSSHAELSWHAGPEAGTGNLMDLISSQPAQLTFDGNTAKVTLGPGEVLCVAPAEEPAEEPPDQQAMAKAVEVVSARGEDIEWKAETPALLAAEMKESPVDFVKRYSSAETRHAVVTWRWPEDSRRVVPVPEDSYIVVFAPAPFQLDLIKEDKVLAREKSIQSDAGWFTIITHGAGQEGHASLEISIYRDQTARRTSSEIYLMGTVSGQTDISRTRSASEIKDLSSSALCTNGRGAMSMLNGAWGEIRSQYDCLLAGNLHPDLPSDRHVMLTRCRAWLVLRGYSQEIDLGNLEKFHSVPPGTAQWEFSVPAGMGKRIYLKLLLRLVQDQNQVQLRLERLQQPDMPDLLDPDTPVKIILRFDIEDRSFHAKTKAFSGPENSWPRQVTHTDTGFVFEAAADRRLSVHSEEGCFTREDEWTYMVRHPADGERGLDDSSDLFSPGYFTVQLKDAENACISAAINSDPSAVCDSLSVPADKVKLDEHLHQAMAQFVVKRGEQRTVIAGYPWFLDWGRDTLICLRGMIACGMLEESRNIIRQFASFENTGTIPNMISGADVSNRDTSDAPLWLHVATADFIKADGADVLDMDCGGRPLSEILTSIGSNYLTGTPNGIKADPQSGLVFSPSHYTWMDTNHPAGTPREGYPIEIQALWHHCVSMLASLTGESRWDELKQLVSQSVEELFFLEANGHLSDCLHCGPGTPAAKAIADDHLRPNQLLAITLGAVKSRPVCEAILQACQSLLIPGAIRTLADRPVEYPLSVSRNGVSLNDPHAPYWPYYTGDEDTRRKPAYHNGTAWTWPFPSYCEAMVMIHGPEAAKTALSYLAGTLIIMNTRCIGQIPEILDGNAPHLEKGCTAQAWGVSEFARVLALIEQIA